MLSVNSLLLWGNFFTFGTGNNGPRLGSSTSFFRKEDPEKFWERPHDNSMKLCQGCCRQRVSEIWEPLRQRHRSRARI
ncbi:hypothetical protein DFH29DRAFT_109745 [Suillus ampliporus]|nr:hypothetical protein DFH29DRAFT_109745 [Suillus ampliporus]